MLRLLTAALTAAVCIGLVAGYYALRVRAYSSLDLVLEGDFPIEADDEIGFIPVRNGATIRRHPRSGLAYHLFTSDRRARVDARGEKTPTGLDLMTIGCSFSWGHGVENPQTYTALIARRRGLRAADLAFASYVTVEADARRLGGESAFPRGDPATRQASLEFLLGRMRALTRKVGAHLVIVYIQYLERGGTNAVPPALSAALRSVTGDGVTVLDLAPVVARYYADPSRPLLRFERDAHPNVAAHALIADELEGALQRESLLSPP